MQNFLSRHRYFIIFYGGLFAALLWPLLLFQKTFIFGDYWQQHYPWAFEYARHLKAGHLPYWLPGVAGGFPLVAEGQVGAYYLPHLLLYALLPFSTAYSLLILLHVLSGGVGFYVYGQKIGLSKVAATVTALLFSFSSAYGGCFSNTAVLGVMAWLPWCLCCWNKLTVSKGKLLFLYVSCLGLMFAQMWTAGAPQMALYAMGYLFCFWMMDKRGKHLLSFLAAATLGILLSLPQWAATLELARESARAGETAGFVFWGSVLPPSIISLAYPRWGTFLGVSFYLGAAALLLCLVSLLSKKTRLEKIQWWLAALFFILAMGNNLPYLGSLLSFLTEKFSLTLLRNPSKFLFFSTVSLALVVGFAFDRLSAAALDDKIKRRLKSGLCVLSGMILSAPLLGKAIFSYLKDPLLNFVHHSAEAAFSGKSDPLYGVSHYHSKADQLLVQADKLFSYSDPWNILAIVFLILSVLVIFKIFKGDPSGLWRKAALPAVLWLDLLIYGLCIGNGFIGNVRSYPETLPDSLVQAIESRQLSDDSVLVGWAQGTGEEALPANTNLLYSLNHAGGYSPLLIKRYYELSKDLGISDSSLGRRPYSEAVWRNEFGVARALGVSQLLSDEALSLPDTSLLSLVQRRTFEHGLSLERKRYLYAVEPVLPFAYAVYDWKEMPNEKERLAYLKSGDFRPFEEAVLDHGSEAFERHPGLPMTPARITSKDDTEILAEVDAASDAVLVLRSVFYPRWKAAVDGREVTVIAVNHAFSGIFLKAGKHRVRFFYDQKIHRSSEALSAAIFLALLLMNVLFWRKGRYSIHRRP